MSEESPKLGEVTYTRIFNAPPEVVFRCMTTPEDLTHFWGPIGVSTPIENITVDLRVGGVFKTIMVNEETGEQYPTSAIYVEIDPPKKLVFSEDGTEGHMMTSITFNDLGDGRTESVTHQTNFPEMFLTAEAQAGMLTSFDRFDEYLATL